MLTIITVIKGMFDDDLIEELHNGCSADFEDPVAAKRRQAGFEDSGQAAGSGFFPTVGSPTLHYFEERRTMLIVWKKVIHSFQLIGKAPKASDVICNHPIYVGLNDAFLGYE